MYDAGLGEQDYENRLHQLPTGASDLAQFKAEFDSLLGAARPEQSGRWVKEGIKKDTQHYTNYWDGFRVD